jgi:glutathione synthase/RimK-type ligase-like ATP-grasp enzyme
MSAAERPRAVALATYATLPKLTDDDRRLIPALEARGIRSTAEVWDDAAIDWTVYDAVLIRSCWDYHLRPTEFLAWVMRLESAGVPLWNPPSVIRWNAEKAYLRELEARGVPVVPTRWIERGDPVLLEDVLRGAGWDAAVVKPAIAATAYQTWSTSLANAAADDVRFRALTSAGRVLVQPFVDAVTADGEWSLMFFGGNYAYAVLKRPLAGDFRVQNEFGGTVEPRDPGLDLITQASGMLSALPFDRSACLYARVDGCVVDGRLVLMELELLEPALFFGMHSSGADLFARALADRLRLRASDDLRADV